MEIHKQSYPMKDGSWQFRRLDKQSAGTSSSCGPGALALGNVLAKANSIG